MSMLPLAIAVARIHMNRADEDDRRREERRHEERRQSSEASAPAPRRLHLDPTPRAPSQPLMVQLANEYRAHVRPDLVDLCRRCDVRVETAAMRSDLAGFIDADNSRFVVNSETSPQRQRFTLAHQIGHWIWHRKELRLRGGCNDDLRLRGIADAPHFNGLLKPVDETIATKCAINLLMSAGVVRELHAKGLGAAAIGDRLGMTSRTVEIRFETLDLEARA